MNRVYNDRNAALRNWGSMTVLVLAVLWGIAEIIRTQMGAEDHTGYLFGAGFLAGAAYGGYRLFIDTRDTIMRLEADFASGQSVVTLWRPWGLSRLAAPLDALSGWRMYISLRTRAQRSYLLRVNHPGSPARPLQIELMPGKTDIEGLRQVAPEAIRDFEMNIGQGRSS
jgi:hypothetical protein